jgi:hypothetical protein
MKIPRARKASNVSTKRVLFICLLRANLPRKFHRQLVSSWIVHQGKVDHILLLLDHVARRENDTQTEILVARLENILLIDGEVISCDAIVTLFVAVLDILICELLHFRRIVYKENFPVKPIGRCDLRDYL